MKKLLMTAGAAVLALTTAASAATLTIEDGGVPGGLTAGFIPGGDTNDLLAPLGLANPLDGFFGSKIVATGFGAGSGNTVLVEVLGFEAGFKNTFSTAEDSYTSTGASGAVHGDLARWTTDASGGLSFDFSTDGSGLLDSHVANGEENLNGFKAVNFFAHDSGDGYIWLFFDDGGAEDDDNHDDLVVRLSAVPLPAGMMLLLSGMGALVLRRKLS